jgi:hypothetical protein
MTEHHNHDELADVRAVSEALSRLSPASDQVKESHLSAALAEFSTIPLAARGDRRRRAINLGIAAAILGVGLIGGWMAHTPSHSPALASGPTPSTVAPVKGALPTECAHAVANSTYVGTVFYEGAKVLEFQAADTFVLVRPADCVVVSTIPVPQS